MKTCKGCKWVEWQKTANGRLHPSGYGKCVFPVKPIVLPWSISSGYFAKEAIARLAKEVSSHTTVYRNDERSEHCPCYAPEES